MIESADTQSFQSKLKFHKDFEDDIEAQVSTVEKVGHDADVLLDLKQYKVDQEGIIAAKKKGILATWDLLKERSAVKKQRLHEGSVLAQFERDSEEVLAWIAKQAEVASATDVGANLEAVEMLEKRFTEFRVSLKAAEAKMITDFVDSAIQLIADAHPNREEIKLKKTTVTDAWAKLHDGAVAREKLLIEAHEVHRFNRNVEEAVFRISEKDTILSQPVEIRDLAHAEQLQRKHERLERDLKALLDRVNEIKRAELAQATEVAGVVVTLGELDTAWSNVSDKATARKALLDVGLEKQKFLSEWNTYHRWIDDTVEEIVRGTEDPSSEEGTDVLLQHATASVQQHAELSNEIEARTKKLVELKEAGAALLAKGETGIQENVSKLEASHADMKATWAKQEVVLAENERLCTFKRNAQRVENWIADRKSTLETAVELADDIQTVDSDLKKHEHFQKSLLAQLTKMDELRADQASLVQAGHPAEAEIQARLKAVDDARAALTEAATERRNRLEETLSLQTFLQDVHERQNWITEKLPTTKLPEGDVDETSNLRAKLQRHHNFQAELDSNQSRIDETVQKGEKLVAASHYATSRINEALAELMQAWTQLCTASQLKKDRLAELNQQQQLNFVIDDLNNWCSQISKNLASADFGSSIPTVTKLIKKHRSVLADIKSHESKVLKAKADGEALIDAGHFQQEEIQNRIIELGSNYADLDIPKQTRTDNLESSRVLEIVLRDVKVESIWVEERSEASFWANLGTSVDDVQSLQKNHVVLETEMDTRYITAAGVIARAAALQNDTKSERVEEVQAASAKLDAQWQALRDKAAERATVLQQSLEVQLYFADVTEIETFLSEKTPLVESKDYGTNEDITKDMEKKNEAVMVELQFKKQQIAERQLPVNTVKLKYEYKARTEKEIGGAKDEIFQLTKKKDQWWHVVRMSEGSVEKGYIPATYLDEVGGVGVVERHHTISGQCDGLIASATERRKRLEETLKLFELRRLGAEVKLMIDENQKIAQQQELGTDLEHNELITLKFDEFVRDLKLKEGQVEAMRTRATDLIEMGHTDASDIQEELTQVMDNWEALNVLAQTRKEQLIAAQEVHRYNRDTDEATVALADKAAVVASDDFGKDLDTVLVLQNEHANTLRVLAATLEVKVRELSTECSRLCASQPPAAEKLAARQAEIDASWQKLQADAETRKEKLNESKNYQSFLKDYHDLASWISGADKQASSDELAADVGGAEELLKRHEELQSDIKAHASDINDLQSVGGQMVKESKHGFAPEVQEKLTDMDSKVAALKAAMATRAGKLQDCLDLQLFNRSADEVDAWISMQEAVLNGDDVGSTLDSVEASKTRHEDMEKSITAKTEKITQIEGDATKLIAGGHYDADAIASRKDEVGSRWADLLQLAATRKKTIDDAHKVQQFLRDSYEKEEWVTEKLQVAKDPTYKDPANLQTKVDKHREFEGNITSYNPLLTSVLENGREIIAENAEAGPVVQPRVDRLEELWGELTKESADKSQKLKEAREQQTFNHGLEDLEFWLVETERVLQNDDLGKDLSTTKNLVDKHDILVKDIALHQSKVDDVDAVSTKFIAEGHFASALIGDRQRNINSRYAAVKTKAAERTNMLRDSLRKQELLRLCEEESSWIREKSLIAGSQDFGRDLTGVKKLTKKHDDFAEMLAEHKNVLTIVADAKKLVVERHYAADEVNRRAEELTRQWEGLQSTSDQRRRNLEQALAAQQLQSDLEEEGSWIDEKMVLMRQEVLAESLSSADALIRKHGAFEKQLLDHRGDIQKLSDSGREMITNQNLAASSIKASVEQIETNLQDLSEKAAIRNAALEDTKAMLEFNRKADTLDAWISDKRPQAESNELGKDLTTVESLLTKHAMFSKSLAAKEKQSIDGFKRDMDALSSNTHQSKIAARGSQLLTNWKHLTSRSADRREKLLHSQVQLADLEDLFLAFARKASEFNSFFENSEEDLTDPVRVNSIDGIMSLKQSHRAFMSDLAAQREAFKEIESLNTRIKQITDAKNPYTWFSLQHLDNNWTTLKEVITERERDIADEEKRQRANEDDRKLFAKHANDFYDWLQTTRASLVEGSGTLELQLETTKDLYSKVEAKRRDLSTIETLSARMEEKMILDNRHTEHSIVGLAQQWDQLEQLGVRMKHNLEQQIQAKNASGVSDEKMQEFKETFEHFDSDKTGFLEPTELKACLRSLGYMFATIEEGEVDAEWEAVLSQLDPNNDSKVSLPEFRNFMIQRESDKAESAGDVLGAFAAASDEKPYMTRQDLEKAMGPEQADYCVRHMKQYVDESKVEVGGGYDYQGFIKNVFGRSK